MGGPTSSKAAISRAFKFTGTFNIPHTAKYCPQQGDTIDEASHTMKVTKHSSESGHPISSEDVTVLRKNTLYMDHLMKVTSDPATP